MPTSPGPVQRRGTEEEKDRKGNVVSPGLGEVDEIEGEFLGEGGRSGRGEVTEVCIMHLEAQSVGGG